MGEGEQGNGEAGEEKEELELARHMCLPWQVVARDADRSRAPLTQCTQILFTTYMHIQTYKHQPAK